MFKINPPPKRQAQRTWSSYVDPDDTTETRLTVTRITDGASWVYRCEPGLAGRLAGFSWRRDQDGYAKARALVNGTTRVISLHHLVTDGPPTPHRVGVWGLLTGVRTDKADTPWD